MATSSASAAATAVQPRTKSERSVTERWLFAAFLLAGAAQLITISALVRMDPITASWSALLLAIAPVLLTAVAAFCPRSVARPAVVAAAAVLLAGIVGGIGRTGSLFIPALVAVVVGGLLLWRAGLR